MFYINRFFSNISKKFKVFYLNSNFYDKKISKVNNNDFFYKPSPYLLSSLIKYQKKKVKIDDFLFEDMWLKNNVSRKELKKLNGFYQ